jgi:DNA-binding NarL/FixJ family response regulator
VGGVTAHPPPPAAPPAAREVQSVPAELAPLSIHLTPEQLLALIEAHGGTRLYIPAQPNQGQALARLVGLEAAWRLARAHGGETVKVPLARHWRIRVLRERGLSYAAIARALGTTESAVHRHLQAARLTAAQPSLFD